MWWGFNIWVATADTMLVMTELASNWALSFWGFGGCECTWRKVLMTSFCGLKRICTMCCIQNYCPIDITNIKPHDIPNSFLLTHNSLELCSKTPCVQCRSSWWCRLGQKWNSIIILLYYKSPGQNCHFWRLLGFPVFLSSLQINGCTLNAGLRIRIPNSWPPESGSACSFILRIQI